MRRMMTGLLLAIAGSVTISAADYPYEPIILSDGVLLIDKGSGWNWILETSAKDGQGQRSWKLLPLPGHPDQQRFSSEQKSQSPALLKSTPSLPSGSLTPPATSQLSAPESDSGQASSAAEPAPAATWQAPPIDSAPLNSYLQAMPDVITGDQGGDIEPLEARPDEAMPADPLKLAAPLAESPDNPATPKFQYGEMLPTPLDVPSLEAKSPTTSPSMPNPELPPTPDKTDTINAGEEKPSDEPVKIEQEASLSTPSLVFVKADSEVDLDETFAVKVSMTEDASKANQTCQVTLNYPREAVQVAGVKTGKADTKSSRAGTLKGEIDGLSAMEFVLKFKTPGMQPLTLNVIDAGGKESAISFSVEVEADDDDEDSGDEIKGDEIKGDDDKAKPKDSDDESNQTAEKKSSNKDPEHHGKKHDGDSKPAMNAKKSDSKPKADSKKTQKQKK